jgi:hypothetical protein
MRKLLREGAVGVAWFKPTKVIVPILPDIPDRDPEISTSRESPKAIFDSVAVQEDRPSPPKRAGFTVHASKNGEINEVQQNSPTLTVAKARGLFKAGWQVHVADSAGRQYAPSEFDEILKFDR